MAKYKGAGRILQIGPETEYGTKATPDTNLNYISQSLKMEVVKEAEETNLAKTTVDSLNIKGYNVSGDFELLLKPENFNILKYGFVESANPSLVTTGVYKHTLTLIPIGTEQKSFTAVVDQGPRVAAFTGLVAENMEFKGDVRQPISLRVSVKGYAEEDATLETLADPSKTTLSAIEGVVTIGGIEVEDVTSAGISIGQGLDDGEPTYGSGIYNTKAEHGEKDVKTTVDAFYNTETSTIRETDYKGNTYIAETITWESPEEIAPGYPYKIKFTLPKVAIIDANPTSSGKETKKITLEGKATSNGGVEALTIETWDSVSTKY